MDVAVLRLGGGGGKSGFVLFCLLKKSTAAMSSPPKNLQEERVHVALERREGVCTRRKRALNIMNFSCWWGEKQQPTGCILHNADMWQKAGCMTIIVQATQAYDDYLRKKNLQKQQK